MEIMIPVWPAHSGVADGGARIADIRGAQVAIVDDNYDMPFMEQLEKSLREAHGAVVNAFIKPLGSAPSPKSLIDKAAQSQVAIVGIGL
ncbi:MAG: hypothetical protein IPM02_06220 [Betaproteobacteria bacterium]|nr:hypothetical protein [Betaproteobacteria bacterium]